MIVHHLNQPNLESLHCHTLIQRSEKQMQLRNILLGPIPSRSNQNLELAPRRQVSWHLLHNSLLHPLLYHDALKGFPHPLQEAIEVAIPTSGREFTAGNDP